jgi:galactose-1-phosphate uridylyltransferase
VEPRRERIVAELLDPRRDFERVRVPLELRWDPLTGHGARILPEGSFPPPARHDLEQLATESAQDCPFCGTRIETATPRFPPELHADGRIRRGEAVLFPNLVPYAKWSSVSVYSPDRHLLALDEVTPALLADNLATQIELARAVLAHDPGSSWISINANHLPPSGSSVVHPHLQGSANPEPTTMQRLLARVDAHGYVETERGRGERFIASANGVDWLASFAPLGPAEMRAFVLDAASPADLDEPRIPELARGLSATLRVYAELGFESFNVALVGGRTLSLRVVARAYYGAARRSDAMWSERLHWEAATDVAPEHVAELARTAFAQPVP